MSNGAVRKTVAFSMAASALAIVAGAWVLAGWAVGGAADPASVPTKATMKANTALCVVMSGLGLAVHLVILHARGVPPSATVAMRLLGAAVSLLAGLTGLQYIVGADFGIDQLFVADPLTDSSTGRPGRMAPATSLMLTLFGAALVAATTAHALAFQVTVLAAMAVSTFAIIAFAFAMEDLRHMAAFATVAPHTAVAVLLLSVGTWLTRESEQPLATFLSDRPGGVIARRAGVPLAAATLAVAAVLEAVQMQGRLGPRIDSAILVIVVIGLVAGLLTRTAASLDRSDAKLRRSHRLMVVASRVNQLAVRHPLRREALQTACATAVEHGGFRRAWSAWLPSTEPHAFSDEVAAVRPGVAPFDGTPAAVREFLDASTVADAPPVHVVGIGDGGTAVVLTIRSAGHATGLWYLESDPGDDLDAEAIDLLETVADDIGLAIRQTESLEAQRLSDLRFEGIIASAMDAIVSVDSTQRIVLFNPAAERMFKGSREQFVGQPLDRLIPVRFHATHRRHVDGFGDTGVTTRAMGALGQLFGVRSTGEEFPVEASISQIEVAGQRLFTVILRDITDRVQREQLLRNSLGELEAARSAAESLNVELEARVAQRTAELEASNRELESFSYSVSHDLRAPLRAMDGYSQALIEDFAPSLPPEAQRYVGRVRVGAQRMGRLIDDLLTLSRLGRVPVVGQAVQMADLVRQVIADLEQTRPPAHIDWKVDSIPPAFGEPALLRQVWTNLLDNAVKYSSRNADPRVHVGATSGNGVTQYFVADNGTGFDMRYADKLFGVFQRLHRAEEYEGTGVGLAIVHRIIRRHGGDVWADAELGRGATFYFTLAAGVRDAA